MHIRLHTKCKYAHLDSWMLVLIHFILKNKLCLTEKKNDLKNVFFLMYSWSLRFILILCFGPFFLKILKIIRITSGSQQTIFSNEFCTVFRKLIVFREIKID